MAVADLLTRARAAHQQYRQMAGRIDSRGQMAQAPDPLACGAAVREALSLRAEALTKDPDQQDPAWREDLRLMKATNSALVDFYAAYLVRAESISSIS